MKFHRAERTEEIEPPVAPGGVRTRPARKIVASDRQLAASASPRTRRGVTRSVRSISCRTNSNLARHHRVDPAAVDFLDLWWPRDVRESRSAPDQRPTEQDDGCARTVGQPSVAWLDKRAHPDLRNRPHKARIFASETPPPRHERKSVPRGAPHCQEVGRGTPPPAPDATTTSARNSDNASSRFVGKWAKPSMPIL